MRRRLSAEKAAAITRKHRLFTGTEDSYEYPLPPPVEPRPAPAETPNGRLVPRGPVPKHYEEQS